MNCIIIDNDQKARTQLEDNVKKVPNLDLSGSFENALKANEFIKENDVDLMFIDIKMEGLNGLAFLRSMKHMPHVIITTDSPDYAVEAFEIDAIDYLLKPIKIERFLMSINKVEECMNKLEGTEIPTDISKDFIFVKSERKYIKLNYESIFFIEGLKDYVILHADKGKFMTAMNVKTIQSRLPGSIFLRTSKSYIINVNHIDEIDGEDVIVEDTRIPIGRSYREKFLHKFVHKRLVRR